MSALEVLASRRTSSIWSTSGSTACAIFNILNLVYIRFNRLQSTIFSTFVYIRFNRLQFSTFIDWSLCISNSLLLINLPWNSLVLRTIKHLPNSASAWTCQRWPNTGPKSSPSTTSKGDHSVDDDDEEDGQEGLHLHHQVAILPTDRWVPFQHDHRQEDCHLRFRLQEEHRQSCQGSKMMMKMMTIIIIMVTICNLEPEVSKCFWWHFVMNSCTLW